MSTHRDIRRVSLIVAVGQNGEIGRGGDLLWHLPGDLQYFKRTTMGHPLIMGSRTFRSIGRALPGRISIVVSRDPDYRRTIDSLDACRGVPSVEAALEYVGTLSQDQLPCPAPPVYRRGWTDLPGMPGKRPGGRGVPHPGARPVPGCRHVFPARIPGHLAGSLPGIPRECRRHIPVFRLSAADPSCRKVRRKGSNGKPQGIRTTNHPLQKNCTHEIFLASFSSAVFPARPAVANRKRNTAAEKRSRSIAAPPPRNTSKTMWIFRTSSMSGWKPTTVPRSTVSAKRWSSTEGST